MIKIFTTLVCSVIFAQLGNAQIELEVSDYHRFDNQYYRGFVYTDLTQVETTAPGPNQFWDYFLLDEDFQDTLTIIKADLTPFFSSFPNAEYAITTNNLSYFYESLSPQGVTIEGRAVFDPIFESQIITPFQSVGFSLPYPINFGDNYQFGYQYTTENASFLPNADSSKSQTYVDVNINVDASGILTIPGGSFEVLRFRQLSTSLDSLYLYNEQNGWTFYNELFDTTVTDFFYTKDVGSSLLTITTRPNTGTTAISFLKGFVINSAENAVLPQISIYPQPAENTVWVDAEKNYSAQLVNLQGQKIRDIQLIQGRNQINREDIPNGIYLLRCFDSDGQSAGVRKLVFTQQ